MAAGSGTCPMISPRPITSARIGTGSPPRSRISRLNPQNHHRLSALRYSRMRALGGGYTPRRGSCLSTLGITCLFAEFYDSRLLAHLRATTLSILGAPLSILARRRHPVFGHKNLDVHGECWLSVTRTTGQPRAIGPGERKGHEWRRSTRRSTRSRCPRAPR